MCSNDRNAMYSFVQRGGLSTLFLGRLAPVGHGIDEEWADCAAEVGRDWLSTSQLTGI